MTFPHAQTIFSGAVRLVAMSTVIALVAGCAGSSSATPAHILAAAAPTKRGAAKTVPVVRTGRYTLVEVRPAEGQKDLLAQIIDLSLPSAAETTVGDTLRIVLQGTGYGLCEADAGAQVLYALPLPAVHHQLGPMTLREALLTLAGPAWTLDVDAARRRLCFARNDEIGPADETPAGEFGKHQ